MSEITEVDLLQSQCGDEWQVFTGDGRWLEEFMLYERWDNNSAEWRQLDSQTCFLRDGQIYRRRQKNVR